MKKEIFEKLKKSRAVIKINSDQFVYILVNADGHQKPKLYNFLYGDQHNKPIVNEVTDEEILLRISEE